MHNKVSYRVICSTLTTKSEMYGIEGAYNGVTVKIPSLSENRRQMESLVNRLNESELDLESFKQTIAKAGKDSV